jgi:serine/threonine-protein kinase
MDERYRLTRLFSRGGMAELYLGTAGGAEGFEKRVAIKRILPHLAEDPEVARMFVAEAKLATYLNHQNIVQIFDVGRGPDGLFIVMELVDGWDLGVIIDQAGKQNRAIPPSLAAFIASQVMAGLCYAYRQAHQGKRIIVAHRDLSPSNLLLSAEGEVKVGDFGIARLEAFHKTEPGTFKGKVAYSAPEVLRGEPATATSDQFSLGVVLYEMLNGRHPFGQFENAMSYVEPILNHPAPSLSGAPRALAEIVDRALSKSPNSLRPRVSPKSWRSFSPPPAPQPPPTSWRSSFAA